MRTISFFSEKGGSGKTSFLIMYASWLKYRYGVSVAVADFNNRIWFYRKSEISERGTFIKEHPEAQARPFDIGRVWPIVGGYANEIEPYRNEAEKHPYATWFRNEYLKGRLKDYDIVLCDFPGDSSGNAFLDLVSLRLINLIIVPTERDQMTIDSTLGLCNALSAGGQNYCCFINNARLGIRNFQGMDAQLGQELTRKGIPMLPDMITFSERIMTICLVDIIRSTFDFPDFTKDEFERISDLGLGNLFIDVTRELKKTKDIEGTGIADLSFVDGLGKTDDGRMFRGSSFPEYEISSSTSPS